ncbi:cardiolipin synthase ClsB [Enterobacteriaceae bacterium BIT-l23]|uniref:cardiolipin synthase ClsB n=1 Tax=Jejubacter sp. L23 TaxID=3092086 RepID=UPI00158572C5|nr:cardiolipin synthase ClsB [Enterobacteriaceae bacterium BIT-l23]
MKNRWRQGNHIQLLENGEAFFPAVFDAIASARTQVLLETFIWFEDSVGWRLRHTLLAAARRGVRVECLLDGYGTPELSAHFIDELVAAGVIVRYYDPRPRLFGMRTNLFRRMHRKTVVVDERVAFVGGLNFSDEHMASYGTDAKQDYAVMVTGPVVEDIRSYVESTLPEPERPFYGWRGHGPSHEPHAGEAQALFIWRDNGQHRDDIERYYLKMLAGARRDVTIANAYFFPGYRLLHAMRNAARRGVQVRLLVQGQPDMPIVQVGSRLLYRYLLKAGVQIFEYQTRALHGKVAVMDQHWATVGSSNLDPLSLSLNLEANLMIHDSDFNQELRDNLDALIEHQSKRVDENMLPRRSWWNLAFSVLAFHFLRHFPAMVGWLPAHLPRVTRVKPQNNGQSTQSDRPEVKP